VTGTVVACSMILVSTSWWIAFVLVIVFLVVMLGGFQRMRREK